MRRCCPRIGQRAPVAQVNTGKHEQGIATFSALLRTHPRLVAAYIGRGTAHALTFKLEEAERDLSVACALQSDCSDAWKRRGQVRAATNREFEALRDVRRAARLAPLDAEPLHQRGVILMKVVDHRRAATACELALELARQAAARVVFRSTHASLAALPVTSPLAVAQITALTNAKAAQKQALHQLALCYGIIGRVHESVAVHRELMALDPSSADLYGSLGTCAKELGQAADAEEAFTRGLTMYEAARGPNARVAASYVQMRANLRYLRGELLAVRADWARCIVANNEVLESRFLLGATLHALGQFRGALTSYDAALKLAPAHQAYYCRAIAVLLLEQLDEPLRDLCLDKRFSPTFKEAWCKRADARTALDKYQLRAPRTNAPPDVSLDLRLPRVLPALDVDASSSPTPTSTLPKTVAPISCG